MQITLNKRWPGGVNVSVMATCISIWYCTMGVAVHKVKQKEAKQTIKIRGAEWRDIYGI